MKEIDQIRDQIILQTKQLSRRDIGIKSTIVLLKHGIHGDRNAKNDSELQTYKLSIYKKKISQVHEDDI